MEEEQSPNPPVSSFMVNPRLRETFLPFAHPNQPFVDPRQDTLVPQSVLQAAVLQWDRG